MFLPDRLYARLSATQNEEFSTVDYPDQVDAESLKQLSHFQQGHHPHQTGTVYREAQEPVATEGSVPVGSVRFLSAQILAGPMR